MGQLLELASVPWSVEEIEAGRREGANLALRLASIENRGPAQEYRRLRLSSTTVKVLRTACLRGVVALLLVEQYVAREGV